MKAGHTYLSTIEITPGKPIIVIGREVFNLNAATNSLDLAEESLPYAVLGFGSKFAIAESNVNAGLESGIESFDAVGGQEENTLKVFQKTKEDADECIAGNILGLASLCNTL